MSARTINSSNFDCILNALPQRYPFLFVDNIIKLNSGSYIHTQKAITYNEWYFQGHFPGEPILPGNIIVEIMAQSAGLLLLEDKDKSNLQKPLKPGHLVQCNVKFLQKVGPGIILDIEVKKKILSDQCLSANVIVKLGRNQVAVGDITIAFPDYLI